MSESPALLLREYLVLQAEVASKRTELAAKEEELRLKRVRLERMAGLPASTVEVEHSWTTHQPAPAMQYGSWEQSQFLSAVTVSTPMRTFTYTSPNAAFVVSTMPTLAARVLECLRYHGGAMTPAAVSEKLGEPPNVVRATLSRLWSEKKIDRLGHGQYRTLEADGGVGALHY